MKTLQSMVVLLAVFLPTSTLDSADFTGWKTFPIASHQDLTVSLRVRAVATLADEEWIAIEFENRGESGLRVKEASYTMKGLAYDLTSGERVGEAKLASGNKESLFPGAWQNPPIGSSLISPGVYRVIEQPSSFSSARLGVGAKKDQLVKATVAIQLELSDGTKIDTNAIPTPFEFVWRKPDDAGIDRMRARLKRLVAHPKFNSYHSYIVGRLLAFDEVSKELTLAEVLVGLKKYEGMITGRDNLARFVDRRFPNDPALIASLEERLRRMDKTVLHDMEYMRNTWDKRLLDPVLVMFEADPWNWRLALKVLEMHGTPQKSNALIARRLSNAIVESGALKDTSVNAVVKIVHALKTIWRTHDRAALQHIKPFLDDKRAAPVESLSRFSTQVPSFRVCDEALEAALRLLDGDANAMYPQFKNDGTKFDAIVEKSNRKRDELIAKVKERIKEN